MIIDFYDVAHGFCAAVFTDNGKLLLVDCGKNEEGGFRPSAHLHSHNWRVISGLFIQNFDQDHVADLDNLRQLFTVESLYRNWSIPSEYLRQLKRLGGGITNQMEHALYLHSTYTERHVVPPDFGGIEIAMYHNSYPEFTDTNNLSIVTFLKYDGLTVAFTGDLEVAGWRALLTRPEFIADLSRTKIFVASHHGRENGFCAEVFEHCKPDMIIISDKEIVHGTQEHDYTSYATGLLWNGGPSKRYVLTTRSDGSLRVTKTAGLPYHINTGISHTMGRASIAL